MTLASPARFASGWEGTGRVEVCEPPHRARWEELHPAYQQLAGDIM